MLNRERTKLEMFQRVLDYLVKQASNFATDKTMSKTLLALQTLVEGIQDTALQLEQKNKPNRLAKNELKKRLAEHLSMVNGYAIIAFHLEGELDLAKQLSPYPTTYLYQPDAATLKKAKAGLVVLEKHKKLLVPDYLPLTDLESLKVLINEFQLSFQTVAQLRKESPKKRLEFKKQLIKGYVLTEQLVFLSKRYKSSHPKFVSTLKAYTFLGTSIQLPTNLIIQLMDEKTKFPVLKATVKVNKKEEQFTSNNMGQVELANIRHGKVEIQVNAKDYFEKVVFFPVQLKANNQVTIYLEAIPVKPKAVKTAPVELTRSLFD